MDSKIFSNVDIKVSKETLENKCWVKELNELYEKAEPFIKEYCKINDSHFLHLDYNLKGDNEIVYLFENKNKVREKLTYEQLENKLIINLD